MTARQRPNWDYLLATVTSLKALERFRIALLLDGRDTRSARLAITLRKNQIINERYGGLRGIAGRHVGGK